MTITWFTAAVISLVLWSLLYVCAVKSASNGGEINLILECVGAIAVAMYFAKDIPSGAFARVTLGNGLWAIAAGVLYGVGLYFMLKAFTAYPEHSGGIALISGMTPVLAVVILLLLHKIAPTFMEEVTNLSGVQWLGVFFGAVALVLINWNSSWGARLSEIFK